MTINIQNEEDKDSLSSSNEEYLDSDEYDSDSDVEEVLCRTSGMVGWLRYKMVEIN